MNPPSQFSRFGSVCAVAAGLLGLGYSIAFSLYIVGFIVNPVWFVWLGRVLGRGAVADAVPVTS